MFFIFVMHIYKKLSEKEKRIEIQFKKDPKKKRKKNCTILNDTCRKKNIC